MNRAKDLLTESLSSFLIKDLITICFSYCDVKEYLLAKWPLKEDDKNKNIYLSFHDHIYILISNQITKSNRKKSNYVCVFSSTPGYEGTLINRWKLEGDIENPTGISLSSEREVYICDPGSEHVYIFNNKGKFLRKWKFDAKGNELGCGIHISPRNEIFIISSNHIDIFNRKGKLLKSWDIGEKSFGYWEDIVFSKGDPMEIFIGESIGREIYAFNEEGKILRKWKLENNDHNDRYFGISLSISEENELYVTEYGSSCFQVYSSQGKMIQTREIENNKWIREVSISPGRHKICFVDYTYMYLYELLF